MAGRLRSKKTPAPPQKDRPKAASGQNGASSSVLLAGTDTALRLLGEIRSHHIDPRDLTPTQRRSCLMLLANGSQTSTELAAMFRTSPSTIRGDLQIIRAEVGREVREWSISEVVGQLALMAEKTTAAAMKQEDPGLAWTIQRDQARLFKELGVIRPETDQSGFRMTVEAIGSGYERAKEALQLALNPTLTGTLPKQIRPSPGLTGLGQVIEVEAREAEPEDEPESGSEDSDEPEAPDPGSGLDKGLMGF